jgi:hypothetical protein
MLNLKSAWLINFHNILLEKIQLQIIKQNPFSSKCIKTLQTVFNSLCDF